MNEWHYCENCDSEFKVITDELASVQFCPLCGEEIRQEEDEDPYEWDE